MTVFVLAGGLGTRLRSLAPDLPKAMVPVGGRPFVDHLLGALAAQGLTDVVLCAERRSVWRRRRLELLTAAFPQALCFGRGWPQGQIPDAELHRLYARARIGWNLHNSTGPINRRLFALPAFGVLQICDNKTGLGRIFRLGEEVVGFDTIPEAIELTHYYLAHADEAREIARRGYERFWRDYHAAAYQNHLQRSVMFGGRPDMDDTWSLSCSKSGGSGAVCGDDTCDAGETCSSCTPDCGTCPK